MNTTTPDAGPHPGGAGLDVLVVGGGLAGLTAAAHAARGGVRVAVVDSSRTLGGRARTTERDGVAHNQGPHALYEAGQAMAVLRELGIDPPGGRPRTSGLAVHRGQVKRLPFTPASLVRSRLGGPLSRVAFARFYGRLGRIDARAFDSTRMSDFLDDELRDPDGAARELVEALVRLGTYTDAPDLLSAGAAIDQLVLVRAGVRYLHGGWGTMVDAIAAAARDAGALMYPGTKIESLEGHPGGWVAVDGAGGRWAAPTVVLAGLSPEAVERLTAGDAGSLRSRVGPDARMACLDLVTTSPPEVTFGLDLDHHGYYSLHAPVADLASGGRALVSLGHYRRPDEPGDVEVDRATLRELARRMGLTEVQAERYLHDMTVSHGLPLAERGGLRGRPEVDCLGSAGLLLAGDWIGPEGMLGDASLASGRTAGRIAASIARRSPVP